jgi:hypothetical protein
LIWPPGRLSGAAAAALSLVRLGFLDGAANVTGRFPFSHVRQLRLLSYTLDPLRDEDDQERSPTGPLLKQPMDPISAAQPADR